MFNSQLKKDIPTGEMIGPDYARIATRLWSLKGLFIIVHYEWLALIFARSALLGQIFVEPLVYTALLAAGLQGLHSTIVADGNTIAYLTFALPGVLALQTVRAFGKMIYRGTIDRRWGLLALKLLSGVSPLSYVLGMASMPALVFVLQAIVATPVAVMLGARFAPVNFLFLLLSGVVTIIFWICAALLVTTGIKNYQQRDLIVTLTLLPLMFSAPVFFPLDAAPVYIQILARFNPLTYQVTAMRTALIGNPLSVELLVTILLTVIFTLLTSLVIKRADLLPGEH